jgi:hypothetical protein
MTVTAPTPAAVEAGRASPFIAVVPVRRWLYLVLAALRVIGGRVPSYTLDRAALIHFGQWGVLTGQGGRLRRPGRLRSTLVFAAVFDGEVDQYIVTFASLLPIRFAQAFGFCVKFPGPAPSGPLLTYIDRHRHASQFFHAAYDGTMCDIRAALWISPRARQLAADAPHLPAEIVHRRMRELAAQRDRDARLAYATPRWTLLKLAAVGRFGSATFTTLAPIIAGREGELAERLAGLQRDPRAHEAFAALPATHYARWAVIDPVYDVHDEPMHHAPAQLLFSVQFDRTGPSGRRSGESGPGRREAADSERYLGDLFDQVNQLPFDPWSLCDGYPAEPDRRLFVDHLRLGAVPTGLFLPGVTADAVTIRAALDDQARFERLRVDHLDGAPRAGDLTRDLVAAFGKGPA